MSIQAQPPSVLNSIESATLAEQEAVIERGLQTFYEVGTALLAIRDQRLYRESHGTFEDYCGERWGLKRQRAYELMQTATVVALVSEISDTIPQRESHVAPLVTLSPEQQVEVWQEAVQTAPEGKMTAAHVTETKRRMIPPIPLHAPTPELDYGDIPDEIRPLLARPPAMSADEHQQALDGLNRLSGGKMKRDQSLRTVENAINTIATQDAAMIAQAVDEDTLAMTFDASVRYLEQWISRYRAAKADRHRVVAFVSKGA